MEYSLEICAYSMHSVSISSAAGVQRVELCAGRLEGGTTPSYARISEALCYSNLGIFPIIRPRGGDFCYTESEFKEMLKDVEMCRNLGVQGIVTGILNPDGTFDIDRLQQIKNVAGSLELCIHRAIDMCCDPLEALELLIDIGAKRVLSSGGKNTAIEGIETLKKMVELAANKIEIMAGSGVQANQIELLWNAGLRHFHASASSNHPSPMQYRNPNIAMGKDGSQDEYLQTEVDRKKVENLIEALKSRLA
jgi:copper homeostasis protein